MTRGALEPKVDALFASYAGRVPGAAVLVTRRGRVVLAKTYGLADVETRRKVTPRTKFRLGALTKPFLALAALLLADAGALDLDATLADFFPRLPAYAQRVTLRHLLRHEDGLPDFEAHVGRRVVDDALVARVLATLPKPVFRAGSRARDSRAGYILLGLAIERATGEALDVFLRRNLFAPLGMRTAAMIGAARIPQRAYGHVPSGDAFVRAGARDTSVTRGDSGIYASLLDLAAWDAFLDAHRDLARSLWSAERGAKFGMGWLLEAKGAPQAIQMASANGFTTGTRHVIATRVGVTVLTNRSLGDPRALTASVLDLAVGSVEPRAR